MTVLEQVELVENGNAQWFFRAIATNGETVAMSEMYASRESAATEAAKLWPDAKLVDAPFDRSLES